MDNGASSYRRFLNGDDSGIVEIIKDYKDGLLFFINRFVRNYHIAEELTEEVFYKLVTKKPAYRDRYSFKTWLYTIGRNLAVSYIKHSSRISGDITDDTADAYETEREYLVTEQNIELANALSRINDDYAKALYLSYFEEQSNSDIAHIMGKTNRQVENLIYRGKQALKNELKKDGFNYEKL